jgi:hypothetical protein
MKTYTFTNGKKEVKTYNEVSNKKQGCYNENEVLRTVKTDNVNELKNTTYDTRFEEVK